MDLSSELKRSIAKQIQKHAPREHWGELYQKIARSLERKTDVKCVDAYVFSSIRLETRRFQIRDRQSRLFQSD